MCVCVCLTEGNISSAMLALMCALMLSGIQMMCVVAVYCFYLKQTGIANQKRVLPFLKEDFVLYYVQSDYIY